MKIKKVRIILLGIMLFLYLSISFVHAEGFNTLSDCLVTNNIGKYTFKADRAYLMNNGSGVVSTSGHFDLDHVDVLCDGGYSNINEVKGLPKKEKFKLLLSVKVEVTQHAGADSDRWLLHELDADFRHYCGIPGESYAVVPINGNYILEYGSAGWDYRWISGNKVIYISYHDSQMKKPEPLEIVNAYLAKHPSTITPMTLQQLRSDGNVIKWINDEMERRLWLCYKWNMQFQAGKVTQADLLPKLTENMTFFLKCRQRYYSVAADADINAFSGYLQNNDIASIQTKLSEYKGWWSANKAQGITLP